MGVYFEATNSIYARLGDDILKTLETIANRYIGQNPPHPFTYRVSYPGGFKRVSDYRYRFDLQSLFPEAANGHNCYAWAKLWSDQSLELSFAANCYGPSQVYCNGERVFQASNLEERDATVKRSFNVKLQSGWNNFILRFTKTPAGFGGVFGTGSYKNFPLHFLMPSLERDGQEGWMVTPPLTTPLAALPAAGDSEGQWEFSWLPVRVWTPEEQGRGQLERIFGLSRGGTQALGWTKVTIPGPGTRTVLLKGSSRGALRVYLGPDRVFTATVAGQFAEALELPGGTHDLLVESDSGELGWGFQIALWLEESPVVLRSPFPVEGTDAVWFYLGPFPVGCRLDHAACTARNAVTVDGDDAVFWQVDQPGMQIRPFLENPLFGKWNYPLGVTLYGLLQTGLLLGRSDVIQYIKEHVELCTTAYQYSLWDRRQYGAAGVNNQLAAVDSLDDCGSFGAVMLELHKHSGVKDAPAVAATIADYIANRQARLENGALYRRESHSALMVDTLWADDLYMSVPFLCRYTELSGDARYRDDAVRQFLLYRQYLYQPERQIMSHVYDFKHGKATGVPWGRGNGWVIFSLSELLAVLPETHANREQLLDFFRELAEGYGALQDREGMWHQVLTDWESYPETSCTSMFTYALARGIRFGWLTDSRRYAEAVFKAWEAICKHSIDRFGNIYGVCRGSGFSFSADYYKHNLSWLLNDTHGIGIVMLAGIETRRLSDYLYSE